MWDTGHGARKNCDTPLGHMELMPSRDVEHSSRYQTEKGFVTRSSGTVGERGGETEVEISDR